MKVTWILVIALVASAIGCADAPPPKPDPTPAPPPVVESAKEEPGLSYPSSRRQEDVKDTLHGVDVPDPYRWLEDVEQAEVKEWMDAQDSLARGYLSKVSGREKLAKRFEELFYIDTIGTPTIRGKFVFYKKNHADKEKGIYYVREEGKEERVLLDPNTMSKDGSTSVKRIFPSRNGKYVAYSVSENNADDAVVKILDVKTGKVLEKDTIKNGRYASPVWTPDSKGFYYVNLPQSDDVANRPGLAEVRFHKLGTEPSKDRLVREKTGDPKKFVGVDLSWDGKWLFTYIWHGWNSSDIYFKPANKANASWKTLVEGVDANFSVEAWKDHFYITTNHEAPRYKVMVTTPRKPSRKAWKTLIPEDEEAVLDSAEILGGRFVLSYLRKVQSELRVHSLKGKELRKVELPGVGASFGMAGTPDSDKAYYSFQSITEPYKIFETSVKKGGAKLWTEVKVPVDPSPYKVEQVWYTSKDGTKVSMFVVSRSDIKMDGSTPFLLYGYGGFNVSLRPYFRSSIYPWLEAGGGFAMPNLRGGGEYGEQWHRDGMLLKKQNVFDDFIGAADFLVEKGYTKPERLAIKGGSNGGLLVGAAMTQAPEKFKAVVCQVPLLDMVRYHKFGSGKTWIAEYGSSENAEQFKVLHAYSPYHHLKPGTDYPALMMASADSDDRVDPMHARKFVAAAQHAQKSDAPMLLRIEKNAGHGGADMRKKTVQTQADIYAFLMQELGLSGE